MQTRDPRITPPSDRQPIPTSQQPELGEGLPPHLVYPWNPAAKQPPRHRFRWGRLVLALVALALAATLVRGLVFAAVVSTEPLLSAHLWPFAGTSDANVLVLGYGGQGHEGRYLTDSLLLLHADLRSGRSAQISIPRDLWVQIPPDSGRYSKINSAYAYGLGEGDDPVDGGRLATRKVGQVTGLPTERWVTIDFQGFRALVDALGGVDIEVERAFSSQYPANDDPSIDPNWIVVSFAAGRQHMDGATAIRYARARYADTPEEASDFARAQRQQRLVAAIAAKAKRPTSWWRAFGVMNALQPSLRTNLAPADLLLLALRADVGHATRIRLDDAGLLEDGTSDDGQSILLPRDGDYNLIARYISEHLK